MEQPINEISNELWNRFFAMLGTGQISLDENPIDNTYHIAAIKEQLIGKHSTANLINFHPHTPCNCCPEYKKVIPLS